ncbi:MAG TPA: acyltransferase [Fibrobacteria bacterium]|nr:acyltransferase [Fibrobacteria bacterium]
MPIVVFPIFGGVIRSSQSSSVFLLTKKDGEFLRVIASVSVVVAHCIHFWVEDFYAGRDFLSLSYLSTILDQVTRFTVPLFFFLSGFGLTLQFQGRPVPLAKYYRFRLAKILAPFLVWSLLTGFRHQEFIQDMPWSRDPAGTAKTFLRFLFLDGFDYQYYFVIVIFQFYLVYPLLYKLGRSRIWMGLFLLLHLAFMSPVETYLELWGLELPKFHPNILLFHWLYCFAGIHAAFNKDFLAGLLTRWSTRKVAAFWIATVLLLNFEFLMNIVNEKYLFDADHFNRWAVVLYCLASLMAFMKAKRAVAERVYANPRWQFLFTHVAPFTFFVYLAHTHVLRVVDYLLWEVTLFDFLNRIILVVAGTYLLAWMAQWLLEDFPRLRFYLGLPNKPVLVWSEVPGAGLFKLRRARGVASGPAPSRQGTEGGAPRRLDLSSERSPV